MTRTLRRAVAVLLFPVCAFWILFTLVFLGPVFAVWSALAGLAKELIGLRTLPRNLFGRDSQGTREPFRMWRRLWWGE